MKSPIANGETLRQAQNDGVGGPERWSRTWYVSGETASCDGLGEVERAQERQRVSEQQRGQSSNRLVGGRRQTDHLPFLVAAAVSTTLMLEATRIFFSQMVFVLGQAERIWLATIATVSFLA